MTALALIALALFAHAPSLPLAAWPALGLALLSRRLPRRPWVSALRLLGLTLCTVTAGLAFGWLESGTLRLGLLLVLTLKWAESQRPREHALVACAAAVAVAIGLLQWGEGAGLLFVLATALLLLAAYGAPASATPLTGRAALNGLRGASAHLLTALPLAAVLFLFFPRIPGPLWDIGLTFGLPLPVGIEQSKQGLGISARLKPGQTQTGASDGQAVLVAEFAGWVPPTSQLYWRGPVFYNFDGQEWQLDADYAAGNGRKIMQQGWRRAADFKGKLQSTAQEVDYTVRLTPHGGLWLYGLDLPARLTSESFIGPDWQVLSHMPVQQEMRYALGSWLEWTAGGELAPALRQRALALPAHSNPRLRALGTELAGQFTDGGTDALLRGALVTLSQGGYRVRDRFTPPTDANALDAFWFDTKEGNAEFFAAAFVVLMRSAGVPARLVTGYRGGKLMALTDYVVVKRSHAHAWAEVWDEKRGWRRADPTDMVAPERFASGPAKPKPAAQPTPQTAPTPSSAHSNPAPAPAGGFAASTAPRSMPTPALQLPDLSDWLGRWVFRLDGAQQKALLGGKGGGFAWLWLLATAAVASALLFGASLLLARWRESRRLPAPQRAWARACRQLAKKGLAPGPTECPSAYANRVAAARPSWAEAMARLADAYGAWRYGPTPQTAAPAVSAEARFLINRILAG
ncbi:MAG: DUF3488 and transglutaminase-like domain-containing protein [Rhodoferax sp.]|nr:DUF3488 and transglutaminase-like domain-containing protein [Rhodoferax sp.]MDP3650395.1 DUF3488 and transglutaminase-like domain-containing protein [Rhodoferax sp.]